MALQGKASKDGQVDVLSDSMILPLIIAVGLALCVAGLLHDDAWMGLTGFFMALVAGIL